MRSQGYLPLQARVVKSYIPKSTKGSLPSINDASFGSVSAQFANIRTFNSALPIARHIVLDRHLWVFFFGVEVSFDPFSPFVAANTSFSIPGAHLRQLTTCACISSTFLTHFPLGVNPHCSVLSSLTESKFEPYWETYSWLKIQAAWLPMPQLEFSSRHPIPPARFWSTVYRTLPADTGGHLGSPRPTSPPSTCASV